MKPFWRVNPCGKQDCDTYLLTKFQSYSPFEKFDYSFDEQASSDIGSSNEVKRTSMLTPCW